MRRKTQTKLPKLYEAQSLQETIQILGARKASPVYNQLVDMAWKIKDETGKIRENMLREAETNLQKDEKTLSEMIHEEKDTEGDARQTGETAQADGRKTGDVAPPGEGSHDGSAPAQSQQGTSQLEAPLAEAVDQVADMGSVDPMNTAVIDYIDDGMSKTEAHNAAGKDTELMEAVFSQQFKKHMLPILKNIQKYGRMQSEAIRAVDSKVESTPKDNGYSLSETIQVPVPEKSAKTSRIDEVPIEETRTNITQKYLSDI
jgi:hypothetical protein